MNMKAWRVVLAGVLGTAAFVYAAEPAKTPETTMYELNIPFDTGRSDLDAKYAPEIKKVAEELKNYPYATATVEGYADSTGPENMNRDLSQKRAETIKNYLSSQYQVDPTRVKAVGFGENKPLADNSTKEGRQRNRVILVTVQRWMTSTQDQKAMK